MDKAIKKVVAVAKKEGIGSFTMTIKQGNLVTFHFEAISLAEAMQSLVTGIFHVINLEIEKHPDHSKGRKEIYTMFARRFNELMDQTNKALLMEKKYSKEIK